MKGEAGFTWSFIARVVAKAAVLFALANLVFALVNPLPAIGRVSVYGSVVPTRLRLPYGEDPALDYNLSLSSVEAMFASHAISQPKREDEYRVIVLGDSSTWGFLLHTDEMTTAWLNRERRITEDARNIVFYNLGYPDMSLTKDLLLLDEAMRYQPDLVLWVFTLESFAPENQLEPFLVQQNGRRFQALTDQYSLPFSDQVTSLPTPSLTEQTIVGQRRALADWLRLQLYGFTWAATRIDQHIPLTYTLRTSDFETDFSWHGFDSPRLFSEDDIAFDVLKAGIERVRDVPVLLVNEPMFISAGRNSDVRYNFFYPRWVYDRYRTLLTEISERENWHLLDLWDSIAPDEFTDSPVHLTPEGARQLAEMISPSVVTLANNSLQPIE